MKRKIYFILILVTCISIATPALARPMFGDGVRLVGGVYPEDGNCYQNYETVTYFLWFEVGSEPGRVEVSCVQTSDRSLNDF
jgi:hypothetical protein